MSKNLASLKEVLSGTGDKEPQTEAVAQLAQELYNTDLLICLIANLQRIDFEVGRLGLRSTCHDRRNSASTSVLFFTGKEGCGSSVQQHRETSDRRPLADGRIHQRARADPLHASERVRCAGLFELLSAAALSPDNLQFEIRTLAPIAR